MQTSQSPPDILWGNAGEFIGFVSAGITPLQLAIANKWQYNLSEIVHLLDNVTGLSRELDLDPVVLLTLSVKDQLVLVLNHTTDGISTCVVIGEAEKAFSDFIIDKKTPQLLYVDLRVDIEDASDMFVIDCYSRGSTLTEVIEMELQAQSQLSQM